MDGESTWDRTFDCRWPREKAGTFEHPTSAMQTAAVA